VFADRRKMLHLVNRLANASCPLCSVVFCLIEPFRPAAQSIDKPNFTGVWPGPDSHIGWPGDTATPRARIRSREMSPFNPSGSFHGSAGDRQSRSDDPTARVYRTTHASNPFTFCAANGVNANEIVILYEYLHFFVSYVPPMAALTPKIPSTWMGTL